MSRALVISGGGSRGALEFVPSKMKLMIKLGEEVAKRQLDKGPQKPSIEEFNEMLEEMRKEKRGRSDG